MCVYVCVYVCVSWGKNPLTQHPTKKEKLKAVQFYDYIRIPA